VISDCVSFDPVSFQQDGLGASEVDVSRGEIAQPLVVAAMVVGSTNASILASRSTMAVASGDL
jgi:hypothetical protein